MVVYNIFKACKDNTVAPQLATELEREDLSTYIDLINKMCELAKERAAKVIYSSNADEYIPDVNVARIRHCYKKELQMMMRKKTTSKAASHIALYFIIATKDIPYFMLNHFF